NIIVATDGGGVNIFNVKTGRFRNFYHIEGNEHSLSDDYVYSVKCDSEGNIWAGTGNGLNRIDQNTGDVKRFFCYKSAKDENEPWIVGRIIVDHSGQNLWMGTSLGIYSFDIAAGNFSLIPGSPNDIIALCETDPGILWIGGFRTGVYCYNTNTGKFVVHENLEQEINSLAGNRISRIISDPDRNLWISTVDSGIIFCNIPGKTCIRYLHRREIAGSLSGNPVKTIFLDESGVLWVGTYYDGINYADTRIKKFNHLVADTDFSTLFRSLNGVTITRGNIIWMTSFSQGLIRYDPATGKSLTFKYNPRNPNSISSNFATLAYEDSKGILWIGTDDGLNSYDEKTGKFTRYMPDPVKPGTIAGTSVWAIAEDTDSLLWIGTWETGLCCYDRTTGKFTNYLNDAGNPSSIGGNSVISIFEDSRRNLWFGTWEGGLSRFDKALGKFTTFRHQANKPESISHDIIMTMCEDMDGKLWIGTFGGGLCSYDYETGSFKTYTEADGLPNNAIMGILSDEHGSLWITTGTGMAKMDPRTGNIRNYDVTDGLQSNEFSQNGYARSVKNRFVVSGAQGINFFHPDSIRDNDYQPRITIKKLKVNNMEADHTTGNILSVPVCFADEINLNYRQNSFSFEFFASHYSRPEKIQYRYMLEGFDDGWNEAGNEHVAHYTKVRHGNYIFKLMATNCDGVWSSNVASIRLNISPPFWKTTWFLLACIFSGLLLLYFFIKAREAKLKHDKRVLEQKVKERTATIEQQKEEITAQRDEIEAQRDALVERNEEITQQKEEIEAQRDEIEAQRDLVVKQNEQISQQNKNITDSIRYAKRIQTAVLSETKILKKYLSDFFVFFRPRDIVSGDFYWFGETGDKLVVVAADCTGHGVPGAFMSMLGITFLNEIVMKEKTTQPAEILNRLREEVIRALRQHGEEGEQKDGMDISLCTFSTETGTCRFAGANNPLYLVRKGELAEYKADRMPIAIYVNMEAFSEIVLDLQKGDCLYLFSDGFADQFGGEKGRKYKYQTLKELLVSVYEKPMEEQLTILEKEFADWKGIYPQVDDVLVVGVKV
ncbi:MAG: two-component regulator propeller domain-containing protein, partial [Bacteroidota bacterium]